MEESELVREGDIVGDTVTVMGSVDRVVDIIRNESFVYGEEIARLVKKSMPNKSDEYYDSWKRKHSNLFMLYIIRDLSEELAVSI